jgi:hypothetical protein
MKKSLIILTALLFVLGVVGSAVGQTWQEKYDRGRVAVTRAVDDEYCMAVWHDGSDTEAGTAVTSAYFSAYIDAACTLHINSPLDAGLDTRVSTDGIIAVSGETTYGAIADAINSAQGWHCQLIDVLRADATTYINTRTILSCLNTPITVGRDSDTDVEFSVGLVEYASMPEDLTGWQVFVESFVIDAVFNDGANYVEIYDCDDVAKTETMVLRSEAAATTVEFWFPTYGPMGKPILTVAPGHRIVVKSTYGAASNPDALSIIGVTGSIIKMH